MEDQDEFEITIVKTMEDQDEFEITLVKTMEDQDEFEAIRQIRYISCLVRLV